MGMVRIVGKIVELALYGTGEVLLRMVTLGRRAPRWPSSQGDGGVLQELFVLKNTWVGFPFWAAVLAAIGLVAL